MNIIHFTGNVGKDAEIRNTNQGDAVCNFNVAVKQGFGKDAPTAWYRVEVWGKRGESLAQHIVKGSKVAVCGELIIGEYEGKPQYRVRAHEVDPFCGGKQGGEQQRANNNGGSDHGSDLDDDVPF